MSERPCRRCGEQNPADALFCIDCGAALTNAVAEFVLVLGVLAAALLPVEGCISMVELVLAEVADGSGGDGRRRQPDDASEQPGGEGGRVAAVSPAAPQVDRRRCFPGGQPLRRSGGRAPAGRKRLLKGSSVHAVPSGEHERRSRAWRKMRRGPRN